MSFPKYVKCMSLPDENGVSISEWVVRLYDNQIEDNNGDKIPTPPELLNRYYTCKSPMSAGKSIFKERPNKSVGYMTLEDLEKFRTKDRFEVKA